MNFPTLIFAWLFLGVIFYFASGSEGIMPTDRKTRLLIAVVGSTLSLLIAGLLTGYIGGPRY